MRFVRDDDLTFLLFLTLLLIVIHTVLYELLLLSDRMTLFSVIVQHLMVLFLANEVLIDEVFHWNKLLQSSYFQSSWSHKFEAK